MISNKFFYDLVNGIHFQITVFKVLNIISVFFVDYVLFLQRSQIFVIDWRDTSNFNFISLNSVTFVCKLFLEKVVQQTSFFLIHVMTQVILIVALRINKVFFSQHVVLIVILILFEFAWYYFSVFPDVVLTALSFLPSFYKKCAKVFCGQPKQNLYNLYCCQDAIFWLPFDSFT